MNRVLSILALPSLVTMTANAEELLPLFASVLS